MIRFARELKIFKMSDVEKMLTINVIIIPSKLLKLVFQSASKLILKSSSLLVGFQA